MTLSNASDLLRVSEYLNHLAVEKALSKNTLTAYRNDLNKYGEYLTLNGLEFSDVTMEIMSTFVAWLRGMNSEKAPLGESSISRIVVSIRNFYKFDSKERGKVNPISNFHPPKIPSRLPKSLTIEEISLLIKSTHREGELLSLRDVALVELLYATGARVSEIIDLSVSDIAIVTPKKSVAVKLKGKGGKERMVPIGRFAMDQYLVRLRPQMEKRKKTNALFLNSRGERLSRQSAWKIISLAAERARISRTVTPHSLRHSFATHLLDGGADVRVVQELLGHSSVTTTQIYTLITIDRLRESYTAAHPRALDLPPA
jgi:integrase/recombinase XerD